jgi:hypothetical protein
MKVTSMDLTANGRTVRIRLATDDEWNSAPPALDRERGDTLLAVVPMTPPRGEITGAHGSGEDLTGDGGETFFVSLVPGCINTDAAWMVSRYLGVHDDVDAKGRIFGYLELVADGV